jgi:hypothetical protein
MVVPGDKSRAFQLITFSSARYSMPKATSILPCVILVLLAACSPAPTPRLHSSATPTSSATATTPTPHPPSTSISTIAAAIGSPIQTSSPDLDICSPLADVPLGQIASLIHNPFNPPPVGSDDPHQGLDLADLDSGSRLALEGRPVQAVLAGRVSTVVQDRFPYGNAILVETRVESFPPDSLGLLELPTPAPTLGPHPALTCPQSKTPFTPQTSGRSLYVLYAHLKDPPVFESGEALACGETIAAIGMTGNALNPHLHLEARVGPSSARFGSIAHYTASAREEEMAAYCMWRVSGLFQLMDPLKLLSLPIKTR